MAGVRTAVIIGLMATHASIRGIGIIAVVAGLAIVGDWNMRSGERVNDAVVKCGRNPRAFTVAAFTARGKLDSNVIWIGRSIVVGLVATHTGIRRIGVIAIVTSRAVIRNRSVRPIQSIKIVVDGEGCRIPVRIGGMAHVAIQR